jgi:hypothetical protein
MVVVRKRKESPGKKVETQQGLMFLNPKEDRSLRKEDHQVKFQIVLKNKHLRHQPNNNRSSPQAKETKVILSDRKI